MNEDQGFGLLYLAAGLIILIIWLFVGGALLLGAWIALVVLGIFFYTRGIFDKRKVSKGRA